MTYFVPTSQLTHSGTMAMLTAAIAKAEEIGVPQCIVILDASGELLGEVRMTGGRFLARKSAMAKALTAASVGAPGTKLPEAMRTAFALATEGTLTGLPGGFPIRINGDLVGAIGVGSGTGDQDIEVAQAALAAIGADS
ncbi:MAG: heme-binding protein [Tateyamaria sp.]|uniref:GlcG/HbpS family heme-binding protein n=1 Tax=Tateyamaria sp. TaxID=1929288 RepID=UPI00326A2572